MFRVGYYANLCSLRITPSPSARRRGTTKLRKRLLHNVFVFISNKNKRWKMGLERRIRSEDTFENKYLFYSRIPQQHSLLQTKAERRRRVFGGGAFGCSQTESAYNKKTQGKNLASAFGVEDGVRTHDLRNHNPAL